MSYIYGTVMCRADRTTLQIGKKVKGKQESGMSKPVTHHMYTEKGASITLTYSENIRWDTQQHRRT
jgi:hypothetical protein